ncbi:zinc finger protein Pegasus [Cricetulus griseus]|uniref:Zinc finger protein Pegasus n=1 Tax=Cricetulus griseus TaxID=10029 RepID=A0A9J7EVN4_CRIGR|nr:zinc finger protein Pegasus [Cricetulus griseus]ERE91007.1 zinc finger protein Pegasus-like protein [Cricetulus griseus]
MGEKRVEPQDFLKNFQEYLSQQTHQVNALAWDLAGQARGSPRLPRDALDGNLVLMLDDLGRTLEGKLQCPYCGYASQRTEWLVEHTRIHTGEKPHRCHLCPFASAYERYIEAHLRSHTGEKPYKCEWCAYRCNYKSNLSHHQRRRHNLSSLTGPKASLGSVRMCRDLQSKSNAQDGKQGVIFSLDLPPVVVQKPDCPGELTHKIPNVQSDFYDGMDKTSACGLPRDPQEPLFVDNPLNQMSPLVGHLSSLSPENQHPTSADLDSSLEENPYTIQRPSVQGSFTSSSPIVLEPPLQSFNQRDCSAFAGPSSQPVGRTSTSILGNSQPSTPAPALPVGGPQLLYHCQHCDTYFADNILYTIHMGCHGYDNPFQCNICGYNCKNKYDFACHFARGQHN